jgi:hypothetical protein
MSVDHTIASRGLKLALGRWVLKWSRPDTDNSPGGHDSLRMGKHDATLLVAMDPDEMRQPLNEPNEPENERSVL